MTWARGSTLAPNLRTIWPSTSTRPAPMSSSQARLLPTPAAASTFCSRTPPGTSVSESRSPSLTAAGTGGGLRPERSRALLIAGTGGLPDGIRGLLDLIGEEGREVGEVVEAGQA